jgi:hypothetical protein
MTHGAVDKLYGGASVLLMIQENPQATNNQKRSRVLRNRSVRGVPINPEVPVSLSWKFRILPEEQNEIS